jgi:hypothetical protein
VHESPSAALAGEGRLQVGVAVGHVLRPSLLEAERVGHDSVRIDRLITDTAANGPGDCTLIDWHSSEPDVLRKTAPRDDPLLSSWQWRQQDIAAHNCSRGKCERQPTSDTSTNSAIHGDLNKARRV